MSVAFVAKAGGKVGGQAGSRVADVAKNMAISSALSGVIYKATDNEGLSGRIKNHFS